MKQKYHCYSLFDRIFIGAVSLLFFTFAILGITDKELRFMIPLFLLISGPCFLMYFTTVEVSDTELTADIWAFLKKRTVRVSDIEYFHVTKERSGYTLFLGLPDKNGKGDVLKILFYDKNFVEQMSKILKEKFASDLQKAKEEMITQGIQINASHRKLKFDEKGIENLKTHDFFSWNKVTSSVEQTKKGRKYSFTIDKTVTFELDKKYFLFALEAVLDEFALLCGGV